MGDTGVEDEIVVVETGNAPKYALQIPRRKESKAKEK